jgi:hypothetical protein
MPRNDLYVSDFYAWANEQARLLRAGKLGEADIAHIAEEIESMGKTEKRELISRLKVLIQHLLKWSRQPEKRGKSWRLSIEEQRVQLALHLSDNPSLRPLVSDAIFDAYRLALLAAQRETGLDATDFPKECPWTFDQMTADDFWPDA